MEEVVRAFNWVIEKGWVRNDNVSQINLPDMHRHITGQPQSGALARSKRHTVSHIYAPLGLHSLT